MAIFAVCANVCRDAYGAARAICRWSRAPPYFFEVGWHWHWHWYHSIGVGIGTGSSSVGGSAAMHSTCPSCTWYLRYSRPCMHMMSQVKRRAATYLLDYQVMLTLLWHVGFRTYWRARARLQHDVHISCVTSIDTCLAFFFSVAKQWTAQSMSCSGLG